MTLENRIHSESTMWIRSVHSDLTLCDTRTLSTLSLLPPVLAVLISTVVSCDADVICGVFSTKCEYWILTLCLLW